MKKEEKSGERERRRKRIILFATCGKFCEKSLRLKLRKQAKVFERRNKIIHVPKWLSAVSELIAMLSTSSA